MPHLLLRSESNAVQPAQADGAIFFPSGPGPLVDAGVPGPFPSALGAAAITIDLDARARAPVTVGDDGRGALRREYRARRRAIASSVRVAAAEQAARVLAAAGLPKPGTRVAAYVPADGEFDPAPVLALARERGCRLYAPVLMPLPGRMAFGPLDAPEHAWRVNRFGIREPGAVPSLLCRPRDLDLVLVPLVVFDARGHRLGMGGGYYDRAFAFLTPGRTLPRPRLLGLAFDLQQADAIEAADWDIPLWGVLTETRLVRPRGVDAAST